jgi:hypothetical protein
MSESIETPPYHYVAYIDEAGDPGIERVRPCDEPGGSEWLVIGAMLIEASDELCPVQWVRSALTNCGSRQHTLHYVNLKERQKPVVCRTLANLPVNLFAMLSNKHAGPHKSARSGARKCTYKQAMVLQLLSSSYFGTHYRLLFAPFC